MASAPDATAYDLPAALLERADELAMLDDRLAAVHSTARGHVVLIRGEAGVGKTSLLREFCDRHAGRARLLVGGCDPLFTPRPLGPLVAVADDSGGELAAAIAGEAMPHEVVAALLHDVRAEGPTIFALEDLHWADEATLDVVRLLTRRVDRAPILVAATYRDDELEASHPLRVVVGELATSREITRIRLAPLSPEAVGQLAAPHAVDPEVLYRKTGGNPFFVIESLAAEGDETPETIRDAVLARAARLSATARDVLEAAAVISPPTELWLLEAVTGDSFDHLDECLESGMLAAQTGSVSFRHELVRRAVAESIAPNRKAALHEKALIALRQSPAGAPNLARLVHHADGAGDQEAVIRFAPEAARYAASRGAHRESAAHYARALQAGDAMAPELRAELLERRAQECYVTDAYDEGIAALQEALDCRRTVGDVLGEGAVLRFLSEFYWCPGRTTEAAAAAHEAVAVLEQLPPGRELGLAYCAAADRHAGSSDTAQALDWASRALSLGESLGDEEVAVHALGTIGLVTAGEAGFSSLRSSLERGQRAGLDDEVARTYALLGGRAVGDRLHETADEYLGAGLSFCNERGHELCRLYLLGDSARYELDRGRWAEAADAAAAVLRIPRTSTSPRINALVVLALVRARRGDPGHRDLLDEAWALAAPTGEIGRLGPVAAARAEIAWLLGEPADEADGAFELAHDRGAAWLIGQLADWRRRQGLAPGSSGGAAAPYALQLAGDWQQAAKEWRKLGCPYETALALADADEEPPLRAALEQLQQLGAKPAAAIVARRLRRRGARSLPRGPRAASRLNAANLTPRELEVLELVAAGLRTKEIAQRLVLSQRTVDNHVAAILRKLNVHTRAQAAAAAARLGLSAKVE